MINGSVRLENNLDVFVPLDKAQHLAVVRRMVEQPEDDTLVDSPSIPPLVRSMKGQCNFSDQIIVNPDKYISDKTANSFKALNQQFDKVFDPAFGAYNDASGVIRAKINLGKVPPPPHKSKIPLYKSANLKLLQEEFDKLESLGVLAKPEEVGVDVVFSSPSLLIKKPSGGFRLCTAFNELGQYTRILPTASSSPNEVLRKLAKWKYMVKSDLTKSFFQIPIDKSSMQYLGTATPFKGLRVYTRAAMGMPGSSEYLQELMCRVLGDFVEEGFVVLIADDIHVCGNTEEEILNNWSRVLERLSANNLSLSASKTTICPVKTIILGWQWNAGTLTPCVHKISALALAEPPQTCSAMRSYIGAFKALSKCIPCYASLISPLEDSIKGLQGQNKITWNFCLTEQFENCRAALKSPKSITIPTPSDRLVLTTDASVVNKGLGATMFILRDTTRLIGGFFSFKLNEHQIKWLPCEVEALAISSAINFFAPYIRESPHKVQVLTDSKACYEAYLKLNKGCFSASNRISTFLSTLSSFNVEVCHIKGVANPSSDFSSRNPKECHDSSCQICKFVNDTVDSVVQTVSVQDIISGKVKMPFINESAWRSSQQECQTLKRVHAHLTHRTRPQKKSRNIRKVKRYLQIASINDRGLLIVKKSSPFVQHNLIVVPTELLKGLITALHIQFKHPTATQLCQIFDRYFYAVNSNESIKSITAVCDFCNALKKIPSELREQSSSKLPSCPGQQFSTDIIRRCRQKIFITRDVFSSFTTAILISDETASSLRSGLISTTSLLRQTNCSVRVDGATGFVALKEDSILKELGITLDYGRVKNPNKNPVIDNGIQELEKEILIEGLEGQEITNSSLNLCLRQINSKIRHCGLSANEIITRRDQVTGKVLDFADSDLVAAQQKLRTKNHEYSSKSKARGGKPAVDDGIIIGDLVYIKSEGDKFHSRPQYIVTHRSGDLCELKKMSNGKFMSRPLEVPAQDLFKVQNTSKSKVYERLLSESDDSDEDEPTAVPIDPTPQHEQQSVAESEGSPNTSNVPSNNSTPSSTQSHENGEEKEDGSSMPTYSSGRPKRNCGPPKRLIDELTNK